MKKQDAEEKPVKLK